MQDAMSSGHLIVVLGAPGAGKGTQCALLAQRLGAHHFSTGELFRREIAHGSALGKTIRDLVESGQLVGDDLVMEVVIKSLTDLGAMAQGSKRGPTVLLDGAPRTIPQAQSLEAFCGNGANRWHLDAVIQFEAPVEELVGRFSSRASCKACRATVSIAGDLEGKTCTQCGAQGTLFRRTDDSPEHVRTRMELYKSQTAPLVDFYKSSSLLCSVQALAPVEEVYVQFAAKVLAV